MKKRVSVFAFLGLVFVYALQCADKSAAASGSASSASQVVATKNKPVSIQVATCAIVAALEQRRKKV